MSMRSRIDAVVSVARGPRVLDIGATGGLQDMRPLDQSANWLHGRLATRFPEVWGIDISPAKVQYLNERGYDRIVVADAQDFDLAMTFDTIIAGELIEHLESPKDLFRAAGMHMDKDARLVITTPYPHGIAHIAYGWTKYPKSCSNPEHIMWFCPSTLRVLAGRCGFESVHLELLADYPPSRSGKSLYDRLRPGMLAGTKVLPARLAANSFMMVFRKSGGRTIDGRQDAAGFNSNWSS